jgi:signal transduction histidine kinase
LKLQLKLAIYNAISKALIILAIGLILPLLVEKVVTNHIGKRLEARRDMILKKIKLGGLDQAILEEDCTFDDYNIFKEEFIHIDPLNVSFNYVPKSSIANEDWSIEDKVVTHRVIKQPFIYDNQWYMLHIGEGISTIDQLKVTIFRFTLLVMVIVVIFSIFIDVAFVRLTLKPFNMIVSRKLKNIKDPTNFSPQPIFTSTYEFKYLDESINELMKKIKDLFTVEKEFISNVSHELLTPISILQNRMENIVVDPETPDDLSLKIIESQKTLRRLSRIIMALLLISKIENAQYLKDGTVDISEILNDVLRELEDRIEEKKIMVVKNITVNMEMLHANRSLMHTMLFNLINNAIKYNQTGGKITLNGYYRHNHYFLEVADTGCGINKSNLPDIFDRFKRFNAEDKNSYGLGLPIVKTIANFHSIEIGVDSTMGEGTVFTLKFPNQNS